MKGLLLLLLAANAAAGVSERQYYEVLEIVDSIYAPEVAAAGGILRLRDNWHNDMVEALSRQLYGRWYIDVYGGIARHPETTVDGFAAILCHEIGHHMGGKPRRKFTHRWGSVEGQADYFAARSCLRRVLPRLSGGGSIVDRITQAGLSFIRVFVHVQGRGEVIALGSTDPRRVTETEEDYPSGQCRLDTFVQGALCPKADAACTRAEGYAVGVRPECWYKPPVPTPVPGRFAPATS